MDILLKLLNFNYPEVGQLDAVAARAALVKPAEEEGVSFAENAVKEILKVTQNYPYLIQEWGFQVWNSALASPITRKDVKTATPNIIEHLDANFGSSAEIVGRNGV